MAQRCCSKCFTDKNLREKIHNLGKIQRCIYCRSNEESTIETSELFNLITPIIEVIETNYRESETGLNIAEILKIEFSLFNPLTNIHALVKDTFYEHKPLLLDKKFELLSQDLDNGWEELKAELINKNRFFPQTTLYKEAFLEQGNLFNIFTNVIEELNYEITTSDQLFRTRISEQILQNGEMKQPPNDKVTFGRANPDGIPYLYAAETLDTCLTEVRPANGQQVNIVSINPICDFKVIDLRTPRKNISFLSLAENDDNFDFKNILKLVNLLEDFSRELSLPVLPHRSRLDYIPTQFITEFFKNIGDLKGLVFQSSFGKGFNVVIFDQELIDWQKTLSTQQIRINGVDLKYE